MPIQNLKATKKQRVFVISLAGIGLVSFVLGLAIIVFGAIIKNVSLGVSGFYFIGLGIICLIVLGIYVFLFMENKKVFKKFIYILGILAIIEIVLLMLARNTQNPFAGELSIFFLLGTAIYSFLFPFGYGLYKIIKKDFKRYW
jgi:peptidoglycan/LPS O-acetylase OafA/YrhL